MTPSRVFVPFAPVLDPALPVPVGGRSPADPLVRFAVDGRVSPDFLTIFAQPLPAAAPKTSPERGADDAPDMATAADASTPAERDQMPAPQASESADASLPLPFWAVPSQSPSTPDLQLGPDTSAPPAIKDAVKPTPKFAENAENAMHLFPPSPGLALGVAASGAPSPWPAPMTQSRPDNPPGARLFAPVQAAAHLGDKMVEPSAPAPQSASQASFAVADKVTSPPQPAAKGGDAPTATPLAKGSGPFQPAVAPSAPPPIAPAGWPAPIEQMAMPFQEPPPRTTTLAGQSPQTVAASGRTAAPMMRAAGAAPPLGDAPQIPKNPAEQTTMSPQTTAIPSVARPVARNGLGGTGQPSTPIAHTPIPSLTLPTALPLTVVERTTTPTPPMAQVEHAPTPGHSHPEPSLITADLAPRLPLSDRADIAALPVAMAKQAPVSAIPLQDDPASAVAPPSPFMITAPTTMAVPGMAQPAPLPDHAPSPLSRPTPSAPTAWLAADPHPATVAHVLTPPDQPTARDQPNATIRPNASAAPPPAVAPPSPLMTTAPTTMAVLGLAQPAPLHDHAPPLLSHPTPSAPTAWLAADPHPATAAHVLPPTDQPTARDQPNATIRPKAVAGPAPLGGAPVLLEPMPYVAPDPIAADLPLADRALPRGDAVVGKSALPQALPTALPDLVIRQILPNIGKEGIVSVTLAPVELGALRFEVTSRGEGLHLHLMVDAAATLDLLRRQGDQILAELRQAGFAQASLSFAPGGGQSGAGSPGGDARSGGAGGGASSPQSQGSDPAPLHRLPTAGLGLLDLRL